MLIIYLFAGQIDFAGITKEIKKDDSALLIEKMEAKFKEQDSEIKRLSERLEDMAKESS